MERKKLRGCLSQENRGVGVLFGVKSRLGFFGQALGMAAGIACGAGCDAMGKWMWVLADRASFNECTGSKSGLPAC